MLSMAAVPSRCMHRGEEGQEKSPRSFFWGLTDWELGARKAHCYEAICYMAVSDPWEALQSQLTSPDSALPWTRTGSSSPSRPRNWGGHSGGGLGGWGFVGGLRVLG